MTDKGLFLFPGCPLNKSGTKTVLGTVLMFKLSLCQKNPNKTLNDRLDIKIYCKTKSWGLKTFPVDWELRVCSPSGFSRSLFKTTALCSPGSGLKTLLQTTFFLLFTFSLGKRFERFFACLQCFEKKNYCYCSPTVLFLTDHHLSTPSSLHVHMSFALMGKQSGYLPRELLQHQLNFLLENKESGGHGLSSLLAGISFSVGGKWTSVISCLQCLSSTENNTDTPS